MPYTCARTPSSMSFPFRNPIHGQYMPTAASNRQKTQKADCSDRGLADKKRQAAETAKMATSRVVWRTSRRAVMMLKASDEASIAAMKLAKMTPYGRSPCDDWTDLSAGVQKKTKRYMEPSKTVDASPRASTEGRNRTARALLLAVLSLSFDLSA